MEGTSILTSLVALAFVLGLIAVVNLVLKRFGPEKFLYRVQLGQKRREATMAVKEVLTLDARRRLLRVTCGDAEHVILLGVNGEQVIETIRAPKTAPKAAPKGRKS